MKIYAARQESDEAIFNRYLGKRVWIKVNDVQWSGDWYIDVMSRLGASSWEYRLIPDYFVDNCRGNQACFDLLSSMPNKLYVGPVLDHFKIIRPIDIVTDEEMQDGFRKHRGE